VRPDPAAVALRCARAASRWLAGERVDLTIRDAASGEFAGQIGLYYQDPVTGQAMVGYDVVPKWRGRGYASRAVRLLAGWAFANTGIGRLIAGTAPANIASQRVLEHAGFAREGLLRGRLLDADGRRVDDLVYGLLAPPG
jgi:RimJ/RimL family protein N-acetyltransferase